MKFAVKRKLNRTESAVLFATKYYYNYKLGEHTEQPFVFNSPADVFGAFYCKDFYFSSRYDMMKSSASRITSSFLSLIRMLSDENADRIFSELVIEDINPFHFYNTYNQKKIDTNRRYNENLINKLIKPFSMIIMYDGFGEEIVDTEISYAEFDKIIRENKNEFIEHCMNY